MNADLMFDSWDDLSRDAVLTPADAEWILTFNAYSRQRNLRKKAVAFYRRQMEGGQFLKLTTLEICGYPEGGVMRWVLLDGQHRLTAQIQAGVTACYVIHRIPLASEQEVHERYAKLDRGLPRTASDVERSFGLSEALGGVVGKKATSLMTAAAFMERGFRYPNGRYDIVAEERVALAERYVEATRKYYALLVGVPSGLNSAAYRASTLSVALATYDEAIVRYGETMVENFWKGAVYGEDVKLLDPRRHANEHLRQPVRKGGGEKYQERQAARSARYLADCWNQYTEGKEPKVIRVLEKNVLGPIKINGTRWKGETLRP